MTTTAEKTKHFDAQTALEKARNKKPVVCLPTEESITIITKFDQEYVRLTVGKSVTEVPTIGFQKMYNRAPFADELPKA